MVTLVRLAQLKKAFSPTLVTFAGMFRLVSFWQFLNASLPMLLRVEVGK